MKSSPRNRARRSANRKPKARRAKVTKTLGINTPYHFTRYAADVVSSGGTRFQMPAGTAEFPFSFSFSLNKLRNAGDFTALFDQYQINKVDLYFKLVNNPDSNVITTASASYWPTLWYTRDSDDSGSMTAANMQERQGVKRIVLQPDQIFKISVKPKFQSMTYQTLTSTGYSPRTGYLDCIDNVVPHYALKTVMEVPNSGTDWFVEVQAKYHMSFKGVQ